MTEGRMLLGRSQEALENVEMWPSFMQWWRAQLKDDERSHESVCTPNAWSLQGCVMLLSRLGPQQELCV